MKKLILPLLFSILMLVYIPVHAGRLQAYMSYATFLSPADGPYIETYMIVTGNSVVLKKNANGKFQGVLEITLIFRQDSVIKDFKKYNLLSPELTDSTATNFNFIDQQRFLLPNGVYDVEISIADKNDTAMPYNGNETIEINYPSDKVTVSGIELVDSYKASTEMNILTKNAYDLIPYILNYYPETVKKITFYAEIYNTNKVFGEGEKYLLTTYIEFFETGKLCGELMKSKKETAKDVNVLFGEFDISKMPTGEYNLVIEVRDRQNKQVAVQRIYIERYNPGFETEMKMDENIVTEHTFVEYITNKDSMAEYIRCLFPVSSENEKVYARNQLKKGDLAMMQKYFLNFWLSRDAENPGNAWAKYYTEVQKVNNDFSTKIKKGYETDRGRVYLMYGPPNTLSQHYYEPSAYPYEIWHYYTLKNQKNKKFVFYNPDLVTNDFVLIHSDALGEVYDYKWQQKLYSRNNPTNDIDGDGVRPHWGQQSNDYFNNPR